MTRSVRTAVACCAAIVTAVAVGACGSSVPSGAVAAVGKATVTKAEFDHWLQVADDANYVGSGTTPPAVPVPPDYTACIATGRLSDPEATAATLKTDCATVYTELEDTALEVLVEGIWIQGEAVDRHVSVTTAAVQKSYETEKSQEFKTTSKFNTFLAESGETVQDLVWRSRLFLLETDIVNQLKAQHAAVSPAAIAAYYKSHSSAFTQPERRNVEFVLASSATTAATVRSLLAGGASYATVAKKYSIDPTTKDTGGVSNGVVAGEETPLFSTAIFKAPVGVLQGPVKTAFGYYVFTVTKSTPATVESLSAASAGIKTQIATTNEQAALTALQNGFVKKWRARTQCASAYKVSEVCANAPAVASTGASGTTTGATTGAT